MRRMMRTLALISTVTGGICLFNPGGEMTLAADAPAAVKPADAKTAVPVKVVVLYSSGVGYFQHAGTVTGDATTELRFKTDQISDIIKSLILEDKNGTVSAVTYPSQDPLEKTLKSFQVDISGNPSLDQLLNQLRGATVTVRLPAQPNITGVIVGVEKRTKQVGDKQIVEIPVLNILSDGSIRAVDLHEASEIHLEDATLQAELMRALTAVASARDQDKKPVSIHFNGQGERTVLLGYVVETPVWKTSYRLVMPDVHQPVKPAENGAAPAAPQAALQGWAVVENQTDNDWTNIELSLVSGRPISFSENLYQPLYIPRPIVVPELFASLRPEMYQQGEQQKAEAHDGERRLSAAAPSAPSADFARGGERDKTSADEPLNPLHSITSVASAAKLGELFEYTVGNVSLPRQSGAMIPIVTDPIEAQRVSIYNRAVLAHNPLNGARLKNTTGKHLLTGPITVIDGSHYAGDAQIDNLPPGQQRLISYGVDLEVLVQGKDLDSHDELLTGKIDRGVMVMTHKYVNSTQFDIDNKSDHAKEIIVEQPIIAGWQLIDTQAPAEKTDALYRFQNTVAPGKPFSLVVKQQNIADQRFALMQYDADGIIAFSQGGQIPQAVKDALQKAAELKRAMTDTERQITENQTKENAIVTDQQRINQTLHTVSDKTQLYTRLLQKLNDQETQLETLRADREKLTKPRDEQQKALSDYIANLSVG